MKVELAIVTVIVLALIAYTVMSYTTLANNIKYALNSLSKEPVEKQKPSLPSVGCADYAFNVLQEEKEQPESTIVMLYNKCSEKTRLAMLFDEVRGNLEPTGIAFRKVLINSDPLPPLPRIIKVRLNGQLLEYNGITNYGSLQDFVLNEGILF